MSTFHADWILPIADASDRRRLSRHARGRAHRRRRRARDGSEDRRRSAAWPCCPALVNAHTHLELSYLHGRIPPAPSFLDWVRPMLAARRRSPDPQRRRDPRCRASGDCRKRGPRAPALSATSATRWPQSPLLREARMPAHVFYELLGFNAPESGRAGCARRARRCDALGVR